MWATDRVRVYRRGEARPRGSGRRGMRGTGAPCWARVACVGGTRRRLARPGTLVRHLQRVPPPTAGRSCWGPSAKSVLAPGALVRNPMVWELLPPALRELSSSLLDDKWSNSLQPNKPGRWAAAAFRLLGRRPVAPGSHLFPSARGQLASERCFCVSWTVSAGLQFSFQAPPSWEHRLG